jgi:hypothetical protein
VCRSVASEHVGLCPKAEGPPGGMVVSARGRRGTGRMDVLDERVAGIGIGKKTLTCCVRTPGKDGARHSETRTYRTMTRSLRVLADWLVEQGVTVAAMESTATLLEAGGAPRGAQNRVEVKGLCRWPVAAGW